MALLLRLAAPSAPPRRSSGGRALPRVVLPESISSECPPIPPRSVSLFSLHGHSLVNFSRPPFLSFHAGLSNPAIHCSSGQQLPPARVLLWSLSPPNCCAPELLDEMLAIPPLSLDFGCFCLLHLCTCACVTECYFRLPVCCSRHSEVSSNRGDRSFRDSEILQECETMSHRPLCTFWYFG